MYMQLIVLDVTDSHMIYIHSRQYISLIGLYAVLLL